MNSTRPLAFTITIALCLLAPPMVAPGIAHAQTGAAVSKVPVLDLSFRGGNALEYIEAIRRAYDDANVAVTPDVALVPMEPVELKRVTLDAAIELLDGLRGRDETGWVQLDVNVTGRAPGALPVWKVASYRTGPTGRPAKAVEMESGVWSLAQITKGGTTPADVLTAIEAALALFDAGESTAKLRFHSETGLLLARAPESEIRSIDGVLSALSAAGHAARDESRYAQMQRQAAAEIGTLTQQLDQLQMVNKESVEWRTRCELLSREVERLQVRADERESEITTLKAERRDLAERLRRCEEEQAGRRGGAGGGTGGGR